MVRVEKLFPQVWTWSDEAGWSTRPDRTFTRTGYAVELPERDGLLLIDPPGLADGDLARLEPIGRPRFILLTCNDHLREAAAYRERWGAELMVNRVGADSLGVVPDGLLDDGDVLWKTVTAIHLPNVYSPGETAFLVSRPGCRVLFVGDALCGGRDDTGVPDGEIGIFSTAYITDWVAARRSLARLLEFPFDAICFGHGSPVTEAPDLALRRFLSSLGP